MDCKTINTLSLMVRKAIRPSVVTAQPLRASTMLIQSTVSPMGRFSRPEKGFA